MPRVSKMRAKRTGRSNVITGRGAYKADKAKSYYKSYRKYRDAEKNQSIGNKLGSMAGGLVQKGIKYLTGFGDYEVSHNALLETNGPPTVMNRGHEFVVRHREYITDIYSLAGTASSPSPFGIQGFNIQPGDVNTFPWLASLSQKFEQYRLEGAVFEYKSLYSDAVVTLNGSIGSVILATEYNVAALPFTNKQQMENYEYAQSSKPSCSIVHPIECAKSQTPLSELYVRDATELISNQDLKTYDFGKFYIASQGIPLGTAGAPVPLGELWVSFQFAFLKPRLPDTGVIDSGYGSVFSLATAGAQFTALKPLGLVTNPAYIVRGQTSIPITVSTVTNSISIPLQSTAVKYDIQVIWADTSGGAAVAGWQAPSVASVTNGQAVNGFGGTPFITAPGIPTNLTTSTGMCWNYCVNAFAKQAGVDTLIIVVDVNGAIPAVLTAVRCTIIINSIPQSAF